MGDDDDDWGKTYASVMRGVVRIAREYGEGDSKDAKLVAEDAARRFSRAEDLRNEYEDWMEDRPSRNAHRGGAYLVEPILMHLRYGMRPRVRNPPKRERKLNRETSDAVRFRCPEVCGPLKRDFVVGSGSRRKFETDRAKFLKRSAVAHIPPAREND